MIESEQEQRKELYKKVNEGRAEIKHRILTKEQLDALSIEELEEEIRLIPLSPKIDALMKEVKDAVKKSKAKKKKK